MIADLEYRAIRVALIDHAPGIQSVAKAGTRVTQAYSVVGEARDGASGVQVVGQCRPDVVLLELAAPIRDGLQALRLILQASPATRVVVLSASEDARMGQLAVEVGAAAYLHKSASPAEIIAAVAAVTGVRAVPPSVVSSATSPLAEGDSELECLRADIATAAHELRSPATILVGLAHTLRARYGSLDLEASQHLLEAIVRQAQVLDRVTTDLLTSSQSERGRLSVDSQPMHLLPALALAVANRDHIQVECADDIRVQGDRVRIEQMLSNLISNAFKYGKPPVRIQASYVEGYAEIRVIDCGSGVAEAFIPKLFLRYTRAAGPHPGGTGIGLFVVKSLAEVQGGRAWYEPGDEGGSQFCFSLPSPVAAEVGLAESDDAA